MDEPTANLDYGNQQRVLREIRGLTRQGYTVLLSTHNPEHALRYAHRVLALQAGRALADDAEEAALSPALVEQLARRSASEPLAAAFARSRRSCRRRRDRHGRKARGL